MNVIQARQMRAFSAQYGTVVGLFWILSFSCYIIGLGHPLIGNLGFFLGFMSFIVAGYLIRHFRRNVYDFGFFRAWRMALLIFMYASLLMAVAQYIYFRYIDQGTLADTYATLLTQPDAQLILQKMMPGDNVQEVTRQAIEMLRSISPIEITFEFLIYNIILGAFLGIPAAWIGMIGKVGPDKE